jgi:hypothetical protein
MHKTCSTNDYQCLSPKKEDLTLIYGLNIEVVG